MQDIEVRWHISVRLQGLRCQMVLVWMLVSSPLTVTVTDRLFNSIFFSFALIVDLQALMIGAGALGFVVVLITFCCLCYCFNSTCKAISNSSYNRVQKRILKQRTALKMMNEERRQERSARNDAMRAKYGILN